MTKEEAIKELKIQFVGEYDRQREAKDMAIKALEQKRCGKDINVPATDCISRHAVLETIDNRIEQIKKDANEINKYYSHLSFSEGVHDGYCRLKCDLRILPSVTPQPKTEVLDKIRAEVKALPNANPSYSGYIDVVDREDVLEIIDKYKAESEV